jgi:uncharacterized protein YndB with AHSA1/START domain
MTLNPVVHDELSIERTLKASPDRVFAAWADPAKKRLWFAQGEPFVLEVFEADFREGGFERSRFRLKGGPEMTNETYYHEIVENRRIIQSYGMTLGGKRISVSLATLELGPVGDGTRLKFTEQAAFLEGSDGVDRRRDGWNVLLDRLTTLLAGGELR